MRKEPAVDKDIFQGNKFGKKGSGTFFPLGVRGVWCDGRPTRGMGVTPMIPHGRGRKKGVRSLFQKFHGNWAVIEVSPRGKANGI